MNQDYKTIDEYIKMFPEDVQLKLKEIRKIIKEITPDETIEKISWGMPTFYLNHNLVHFAAHKNHIGFYPGASGIENFKKEFDKMNLKYSKGAVQFPYHDKLPKDLIQKIVIFRVDEEKNEK